MLESVFRLTVSVWGMHRYASESVILLGTAGMAVYNGGYLNRLPFRAGLVAISMKWEKYEVFI